MIEFEDPTDLAAHAGEELGVSPWLTITQEIITRFAEVTGDFTWIHVDTARAAREMPGGKTIAHGYLTLSLAPQLMGQIYAVKRFGRIFNYGVDRLRYVATVPRDSRIRVRLRLKEVERRADEGFKFTFENILEIEHGERPAAVYEMIVLMYAAAAA